MPLRVAFLTPGFYQGGAEVWIVELCRRFNRRRIVPTAIVVCDIANMSPVMRSMVPANVAVLPASQVVDQWPAFADIVIGWGKCDLKRNVVDQGIKAVSVIHGASPCDFTRAAVSDAIEANVPLVGVNAACRNVLPASHRERMAVIANGIDDLRVFSSLTKQQARKSLGLPDDAKVCLYFGRVMPDKDIMAIAKGIGLLPDWTLVVCGPFSPWIKPDLAGMSEAAKGRFVYLPPRPNGADLFRAADVFALLSPSEAHSLAATEAWLAGVPTVLTDLPWLRSIEERHGALTSRVNVRHVPYDVAAAIEKASKSSGLASQAQRVASEHFTASAMARRWEAWLIACDP